jgi:hypothetical protein
VADVGNDARDTGRDATDARSVERDVANDGPGVLPDGRDASNVRSDADATSDRRTQETGSDAARADVVCVPACGALGNLRCNIVDGCGGTCMCTSDLICGLGNICIPPVP